MTQTLTGHCHCGAIRISLESSVPVAKLPLRACQCGFCRRHGGLTTGDPDGRLHIEVAPGALSTYRFGQRQADTLICDECGVYVGMTLSTDVGLIGVLNVRGVGLEAFDGREPQPMTYDHESDEERLARRKARWTPTVLVEALPSA
ncbi:MAG: aldehyde-activating protein [Phenylobacterium sp.]|uniref:GFA family protein n=1 Tax=Phenylobacterium sp. TaxID=1871053 RepID=UPI002733EF57|nr:aldehyde-activating protein [Phenylobacterium sp.]MDP3749893.1 aldehyde-activating protein [Phenylobacterium sp.]